MALSAARDSVRILVGGPVDIAGIANLVTFENTRAYRAVRSGEAEWGPR